MEQSGMNYDKESEVNSNVSVNSKFTKARAASSGSCNSLINDIKLPLHLNLHKVQ